MSMTEKACIICGCTEQRACMTDDGPCAWSPMSLPEVPICTGCEEPAEAISSAVNRSVGETEVQLFAFEGGLNFRTLREANVLRCGRWHPGGLSEWSLSDWAVAMAGEAGEACNVVKKLNRERDGIAGNTVSVEDLRQQLADEIADVAIYLDIMAASEGIDLAAAIARKFNATSEKVGFPERLVLVEPCA